MIKKHSLLLCIGLAGLFTACSSLPSQARDVEFAWDRNPEPEVNEYRIEVRDVVTNAVIKSAIVSDNPETPENDTPITVLVPNYPLRATKVVAFAIARTADSALESLPSVELPVEAFVPGAPQNLRRGVGGAPIGAQSIAPTRPSTEKRKIGK